MSQTIAVPAQKNWGEIQFCSSFIKNCPNHDFVAFHGDDKMLHRYRMNIFFLVISK